MTHRRSLLKSPLGTLSMIACLIAADAGAQGRGDLPTAQEIWRHLPGRASDPAPRSLPEPRPEPKPPTSAAALPGTLFATRSLALETAATRPSPTRVQARVVIHYPERGGSAQSQELARLLRDAGVAEVETRPVRHPVQRQSIRYFHGADRDLSGIIADMVGPGGRATMSDFTFYRPQPRTGTVEIWLP